MAASKKNSPEFKAKVGYEAALSSKQMISELAKKHKVSEQDIINWAANYGGVTNPEEVAATSDSHDDHHDAPEGVDYSIEVADGELTVAVEEGLQEDKLNYGKLGMWITIGLVTVISLVLFAAELSEYTKFQKAMSAAGETENYEITRITNEQNEALNSFGVVDADKGIYSIPIDSAINMMAK